MHRSYEVGGTRFGVRTTSRSFGDWLDHALGVYRLRRRLDPEYSIVVDGAGGARAGKGVHILYQGVGQVIRTRHLPTLGRALVAELEARVAHERGDAIYVHAAPVCVDGVIALVPAWVVAHVGTLGRRVDRARVSLPVARWAAVDPNSGWILRPPRLLDLPADALEGLERMSDGSGEARGLTGASGTVDAVVSYLWGSPSVGVVSRGIALQRLAAATANLPNLGGEALDGLGRLVAGARCYEVGVGTARQMLDALVAVAASAGGEP